MTWDRRECTRADLSVSKRLTRSVWDGAEIREAMPGPTPCDEIRFFGFVSFGGAFRADIDYVAHRV